MRGSTLRHVQNASDLPSQNNNNNDNSDNSGYRGISDDETASQQDENEPHLVEVALNEGADEAEILTEAAQTEKQRRDLLPGELYDFLNSGQSYRKVALQFFDEKIDDQTLPRLLPPTTREECYNIYNPNLKKYKPVPKTSIIKSAVAIRKVSAIYIALTYILPHGVRNGTGTLLSAVGSAFGLTCQWISFFLFPGAQPLLGCFGNSGDSLMNLLRQLWSFVRLSEIGNIWRSMGSN